MDENKPDYSSISNYGKEDVSSIERKEEPLGNDFIKRRNALAHDKVIYNNALAIEELWSKRSEAENAWFSEGKKSINSLRQLVEQLPEGVDKERLLEELKKSEEQTAAAQSETRKFDQEIERETRSAAIKRETFESKWKLFRQILERESIASIMGALLMLFITLAIIIGMFTGIAAPDILGNAFLVILGYFFGQSVQRAQQEQ